MLLKILKYIKNKIRYSKECSFNHTVNIGPGSIFEGMNKIHNGASFVGVLGYGSYIGPNSNINAKVGRFTSIASNVIINNGTHAYTYPYVSTAPCFYSLNKLKEQNGSTFADRQVFNEYRTVVGSKYSVHIGNDCWIGEGVFIVGGCTIADGAVVLAHAVVTKDIPSFAIVGGVPAKIIGYRYELEDIDFIQKTKWWNNTPDWFSDNWSILSDYKAFKEYYGYK